MGKRPRSEDDENYGCEGLRKTHISEREVNLGVLQERKMQDVYNKTMAMLFRGTKNLANNNAVLESEKTEDSVLRSRDRQSYRQLSLSSQCRLQAPSLQAPSLQCVSCVRADCEMSSGRRCGRCGGKAGSLCVQQCRHCDTSLCALCATLPSCSNCYQ